MFSNIKKWPHREKSKLADVVHHILKPEGLKKLLFSPWQPALRWGSLCPAVCQSCRVQLSLQKMLICARHGGSGIYLSRWLWKRLVLHLVVMNAAISPSAPDGLNSSGWCWEHLNTKTLTIICRQHADLSVLILKAKVLSEDWVTSKKKKKKKRRHGPGGAALHTLREFFGCVAHAAGSTAHVYCPGLFGEPSRSLPGLRTAERGTKETTAGLEDKYSTTSVCHLPQELHQLPYSLMTLWFGH